MNKRDLKEVRSKTLKENIYSIYIDMNKRDLKKLTKAQLIRLLLKQEKIDKLKSQAIALSTWLMSIKTESNIQNS